MLRERRPVGRRPGLVAEGVGYGVLLLGDLLINLLSDPDGGDVPAATLIGLLVAALVLLRYRAGPRIEVVAAAALGASLLVSALVAGFGTPFTPATFSFTEQIALGMLVVALLRRARLRAAATGTAVAAVAIVWSSVDRYDGVTQLVVLSALGWGAAVAIGLALRESDTRRRAAVHDVRSTERMELARELHDVVAHHVTGIVVAAQAAAVVAERSPEEVDRALTAIEDAGGDALAAMRSMVGVLRGQPDGPAGADGGGGGDRTPGADLAGVRTLVARFDPHARTVRLTLDPALEQAVLPAGVAATGYRVVQEALTNVRRHAPEVTAVEVDVRLHDRALLLVVRNDGARPNGTALGGPALGGPALGGPALGGTALGGTASGGTALGAAGGGFGLVGMAERVAALDGALDAGPSAPGVWTVTARLPLP